MEINMPKFALKRETKTVSIPRFLLLVVLLIPLLAGCYGKSSSKKTASKSSFKKENFKTHQFKAKSSKLAGDPKSLKPDHAIRKLIKDLAENRPVEFWNALPASYQSDLNAYIHEFAANMDAELWDDVFELLERIENLIKSRKKAVLAIPEIRLANNLDRESIEDLWDGYTDLLEILLTSEFADLKKLMRADLGIILQEKGSNAMNLLAAISSLLGNDSLYAIQENLASMQVELLESSHLSATLRFTDNTSRNEPFEQKYVQVEGKWVPVQWAQNWQKNIELLRFRLRSQLTRSNLAWTKKSMKEFHEKIDPVLTQLEQATTDEDFQQKLRKSGILTWLLAKFRTTPKNAIVPPLVPTNLDSKNAHRKKRTYNIVIVDSVSAKEASDFADTFFELIADIDIAPPERHSSTTTFSIDTKIDFPNLLKKLSFVEIVKSDETKGVIQIRLKK